MQVRKPCPIPEHGQKRRNPTLSPCPLPIGCNTPIYSRWISRHPSNTTMSRAIVKANPQAIFSVIHLRVAQPLILVWPTPKALPHVVECCHDRKPDVEPAKKMLAVSTFRNHAANIKLSTFFELYAKNTVENSTVVSDLFRGKTKPLYHSITIVLSRMGEPRSGEDAKEVEL